MITLRQKVSLLFVELLIYCMLSLDPKILNSLLVSIASSTSFSRTDYTFNGKNNESVTCQFASKIFFNTPKRNLISITKWPCNVSSIYLRNPMKYLKPVVQNTAALEQIVMIGVI